MYLYLMQCERSELNFKDLQNVNMCLIDIRHACTSTANGSNGYVDCVMLLSLDFPFVLHVLLSNLDAIATEEWKKEVQKHEQYIKDLEEKFKTKCEKMKVSAKIIIKSGHAGDHVCKTAQKEGAAFLVVGSRGMGTIRRTILGSVSDYIIHHAHAPVILVPKVKN